jgi:outer membrane protein assembly factor BamB
MNIKRIHGTPVGALLVLMYAAVAPGAEAGSRPGWPEFHGPGRVNVSTETGLLKKWPADGPRLIWKYSPCGQGYSGVSIAQGSIFSAGNFDDVETLVALGMDGRLLWKSPHGPAWHGPSPGARTTPTYDDGTLYQMTAAGRLGAFAADSGKLRWDVDLPDTFGAESGVWGFAENVIVEGGKVLCLPGGSKGRAVALDKHTGKVLWTNTEIDQKAAYCSPVVVAYGGHRQLITMTQKTVVGVDVESGKLLWSAPFVPRSPQNALTPVFHDGYVFVACGHSSGGSLFKIDLAGHGATLVWHRKDLDNCHGGAVLVEGNLYGCGCRQGGKSFYCVDFLSGATHQLDKTLGKVGITCAEGMLYCLNHRGRMFLLAMKPEGFEIVSQFDLDKKPDNSYLAHPVVCGGRLYLRCADDLYAYDIRRK